jgi:hypothetical protein
MRKPSFYAVVSLFNAGHLYGYPQNAEAALVVMEGDALDQPRDLLGRGSALGGRGIHA